MAKILIAFLVMSVITLGILLRMLERSRARLQAGDSGSSEAPGWRQLRLGCLYSAYIPRQRVYCGRTSQKYGPGGAGEAPG